MHLGKLKYLAAMLLDTLLADVCKASNLVIHFPWRSLAVVPRVEKMKTVSFCRSPETVSNACVSAFIPSASYSATKTFRYQISSSLLG